jgi:hypothetical protein
MHDEDIRRRSLAPAHEDEIMERSVLTQVLVLHPAQLTILELALRVEADSQDAGQDALERAVRELSRDGLLFATVGGLPPAGRLFVSRSLSEVSHESRERRQGFQGRPGRQPSPLSKAGWPLAG